MGYLLKFLIFFLAIWVVISFIKKLTNSGNKKPDSGDSVNPEQVVQCAHCGVYIPRSKAKNVSGKNICKDCQNQPEP